MMRLYNYGGEISKGLLITDLADIKFVDFINTFDLSQFTDSERLAVNRIKDKVLLEDISFALTANDARLVFAFNKLMVKYPTAKEFYGLNEWVIVYHFLKDFYDKSLPQLDSVIRFFNLYIGKMYAQEDALSPLEIKEMVNLYDAIKDSLSSYVGVIPAFIFDEFKESFVLDGIYEEKYDKLIMEEAFNELITALQHEV